MYGYSPECIAIARLGNIWLWRSSEEMLFQMPRYVSLSQKRTVNIGLSTIIISNDQIEKISHRRTSFPKAMNPIICRIDWIINDCTLTISTFLHGPYCIWVAGQFRYSHFGYFKTVAQNSDGRSWTSSAGQVYLWRVFVGEISYMWSWKKEKLIWDIGNQIGILMLVIPMIGA